MHRFRKKSDAKRAQVPEHLLASSNPWSPQPTLRNQHPNPPDALPALPPASDFRTSLILPSLSRRFTLLRTSNGAPVSLDDMRSKFAEQRALGAEHQISEEEEETILQALSELQAVNTVGLESPNAPTPNNTAALFSPSAGTFAEQQETSVHLSVGADSDYPSSIKSGIASSIASSPSSTYHRSVPSSPAASRTSTSPRYTTKRNSNNMFGSGRFHDTSYLRSVSKSSVVSARSTNSVAGSDSHAGSVRSARSAREVDATSGRPVTPDVDAGGDPSSPERVPASRTWSTSPYSPISALPPRLSKEFTVQQVKRTSLALEQVFRDIEEEAEETIMVPRTSLSRAGTVTSRAQSPQTPHTPSAAGTPIPWMTDEARVDDRDDEEPTQPPATVHTSSSSSVSSSPSPGPYPRPGTTSPTPRLPGYIPGMARPLTPRDADSDRDDGATGYSTTPRARSPAQPHQSFHSYHSHSFSSSRHHHHSSLSSDGQSILPPSILRSSRGTGSPQVPPMRTASPGFGARSRGNSVNSPPLTSPVPSPIPEERFKSDLMARRPLSPIIGPVIGSVYSGSRPGTPSGGGGWPPSSPLAQVHTIPPVPPRGENDSPRPSLNGHNRNGSIISGDSGRSDGMSVTMSLPGPALPDSPLIDGGRNGNNVASFSTFRAWEQSQIASENRNGAANGHLGNEEHRDSSISSLDIGRSSQSGRPSAAAAKIAARVPTPVHTDTRSPTASESGIGNGHGPILLHRTVSKRSQKRLQSPTPPPYVQSQAQTTLAYNTPSSSNSSSNVNLNPYSEPSPLFSPILNTSASSLLSVGSSYHSWADESGKKSGWDQLVEYDSQRSAWQDIMNTGAGGPNETDDVSETFGSPEQVLHSLIGLTKGDLAAVQTRLVTDALTRKEFEPPRSPTRRRRMSTSRASYSAAQSGRESGTNSPAPPPRQATPVTENGHASPAPRHSPDNTLRANALLDSVLNSIQSQSTTSTPPSSDVPSAEPPSSTDDDSSSKFPSISSSGRDSREDDASALRLKAITDALSASEGETPPAEDPFEPAPAAPEPSQSIEEDSGEATEVPPSQLWRSPLPPSHGSANDSVQLVRDVSRRATAATAALKSPSLPKVGEPEGPLRRKTTKRIDLQKISSPHLVSSSTSVNAIPISRQTSAPQASSPTPDSRSPSKLSQRFKKLRGTLRTRPSTRDGEEVTPFMLPTPTNSSQAPNSADASLRPVQSPAAPTQTLMYAPEHVQPGATSAIEPGRFRVPVPSPPASAGPGLKGFMARFRKPRKETVNTSERSAPQSPESTSPVSPPHERDPSYGPQGRATSPPGTARPHRSRDRVPVNPNRARSPTPDPTAVNQLFNAASELGLDQSALNELLARSTSTSSRTTAWTQASVPGFASEQSNSAASRAPPLPRTREGHSLELPRTADQSYKPPARSNTVANRHPEGEIVRRTIIFASDNPSTSELSALVRKDSMSGRPQRSASTTSVQSTGSAGREPPVPRLPSGLGRTHSSKPSDSSSFYDMYSQEQSYSVVQNGSPDGPSSGPVDDTPSNNSLGEQGTALEVLQLSNGQVVWSVLDSLRAAEEDDSESLFRRSMASSRGNDISDDLEVRFKEHRRWPSKGSNYSQGSHGSRRRPVPGSSEPRPETKLFKTNSSTIGRLIEDLSKNMDSGSFNFMRPNAGPPSTSTSFHSDASTHQVERDLEALLNIINPR